MPEASPSTAAFSIEKIPVSSSPLGAFPYFSLPTGYEPMNSPKTLDLGHFLFWTGSALQDVEGKVFSSYIKAQDEKSYSPYELRKGVDASIKQAGGVEVANSQIPSDQIDKIPEEIKSGQGEGLGDVYNDPVQTWVIRRPDRQIWVHFTTNSSSASWTIVDTKPDPA